MVEDHTATTEDAVERAAFVLDEQGVDFDWRVLRALAAAGLLATARPDTTTEYRARFSYPPSILGPASDTFGPVRQTAVAAGLERVPRSDETHGWLAGVQRREVTAWTEVD